MHIEAHRETIKACRFCFMCRHLSPIANVTFREADTPRGRALWLDRVLAEPRGLAVPDFQQTLYDADLSAACRKHCVNHYDEVGLILAARRDLMESGQVPASVETLRGELAGSAVMARGDAAADVVVYEDAAEAARTPEVGASLARLLAAAGYRARTVTAHDTGKALMILGDHAAAQKQATRVRDAIAVGGPRCVVTSSPAAYDAFRHDYPALGTPLAANIEVLYSSDLILRLLDAGKLRCRPATGLRVWPLASDFLRNYIEGHDAIGRVLDRLGAERVPFGTNHEESYTAGEGAVVLDRLNPRLAEKLSRYVIDRVANPAENVLLSAAPYTKHALRRFSGGAVRVTTLEETVAGLLP